MSLFAVTNLLSTVLAAIFAIFAFIAGRTRVYRLLMTFYILCVGWCFGAFMIPVFLNNELKVWGWKWAYSFGFFIAPIFYHLITVLGDFQKDRFILIVYGQAFFFLILTILTPFVIGPQLNQIFNISFPVQTFFLSLAIASYFFITAATYVRLFQILKTATGRKKEQALFFFWGCFSGFIGGTLFLLPVFNIHFRPSLSGNLGIAISAMVLTYGMLRNNILELEELAEAAHREKLVAIGTLATSINHEIRNPLYIIKGLADSHLANFEESVYANYEQALDKANAILGKTAAQASRAMDIMKRFSVFAKQDVKQEPQVERVDLSQILSDVLPLVNHELELDKIEFKQNVPFDLPSVKADRRHLEEILFNLIVNACQAIKGSPLSCSNKRGSLSSSNAFVEDPRLKACGDDKARIEITAAQQNGHVNILIKDNGPGIPSDKLDQIFKPFYTTKDEGTGLGLYITKQLVERNGGKISVKSKVGEGTSFSLEFKR